jgi:hypothetical protein
MSVPLYLLYELSVGLTYLVARRRARRAARRAAESAPPGDGREVTA